VSRKEKYLLLTLATFFIASGNCLNSSPGSALIAKSEWLSTFSPTVGSLVSGSKPVPQHKNHSCSLAFANLASKHPHTTGNVLISKQGLVV